MQLTETIFETYTYGVKGGSLSLTPPPPQSVPLHIVQAVRSPLRIVQPKSPSPAALTSRRLK